ncbi:porin family protein [Sphingobacterium yanglingense]|uniref:Outer membrane protein with beta-barrel domain n=1 Tax=Sphingobacterium yanglingense TaxID=1437280 RepID=A0A4R6W8A0_9SPHI|nr:porin family protein [Sphingobacterium yanglingense]TDQ75242.1 outer membrane protein with beta-barrel domain [Sphingobacterium yanglingense]
MRKINKYIIALSAVLLFITKGNAQEAGDISVDFILGGKIGGAAPLSLPVEIRKIKSYNPNLPFYVGAKANYAIDSKWGVAVGAIFEGKGMDAKARVKGYKTTFSAVNDSEGKLRGYYTGDITTKIHNLYISVPVQATYQVSERWNVQAGPYVAFAVRKKFYGEAFDGYLRHETPTGDKINIDKADYDFSNSVRNIDVGMSLGAKYAINNKFSALAQFDYGFNNIMKTGFESISFGMHNIFMNIGVGYKLK